ncbi:MAG: hypothetical protein ACOY3P_20200 [Planctomycetota bacterium]
MPSPFLQSLIPRSPSARDLIWGGARHAYAPPPAPPTEEETESLLGRVLSGVETVGNVLDLPGSSARDLLAGENPFDQWLSPTSGANRTGGRELLRKYGLVGDQDSWGNWTAGLATEIGTDPLTWITGPLGTYGKSAAAVGRAGGDVVQGMTSAAKSFTKSDDLAKAMAHHAAQTASNVPTDFLPTAPASIAEQFRNGQRGLVGISIPFTGGKQLAQFGAGGKTGRAIGDAIDAIFYADEGLMGKVNSPLRAMRSLLSSSAQGSMSGAAQKAKDLAYAALQVKRAAVDDLLPALMARNEDLFTLYDDLARHHQQAGHSAAAGAFNSPTMRQGFENLRRSLVEAEDLNKAGIFEDSLRKHFGLSPTVPLGPKAAEWMDKEKEFLEAIKGLHDEPYKKYLDLGGRGEYLGDTFIEHMPRRGHKILDMEFWKNRKKILRDFPGGTKVLNEIAYDPRISGYANLDAAGQRAAVQDMQAWLTARFGPQGLKPIEIQQHYLFERYVRPALDDWWGPKHLDRDIDGVVRTYQEVVDLWMQPGQSVTGRGPFPKSVATKPKIELLRKYMGKLPADVQQRGLFPFATLDDWYDYMGSTLAKQSTLESIHDLLSRPGMVKPLAGDPDLVPLTDAWLKNAKLTQRGLMNLMQKMPPGTAAQDLGVPQHVAKAIRAYADMTNPKTEHELATWWKRMLNTYRGSLTTYFPNFHSRNLAGGIFQMASDNKLSTARILKGLWQASEHIRTGGKKELPFLDEIKALPILGRGQLADVVGQLGAQQASQIPTGYSDVLKPLMRGLTGKASWDPLAVRGGFRSPTAAQVARGAKEKLNFLAEAGEAGYNTVEFLLRAGYYSALRQAGYSAAQATRWVKRSHFDYSDISKFEKDVGRNVAMFYTWQRKSIPYTLQKLLEAPGGKTAQSIRAFATADDSEQQYTPEFLKERLAVPVGGKDRQKTYLLAGGLPIEDLNLLGPTPKRTAEKLVSMTNPPLTALAEWLTGKQLYSGRPLEYLDSPTERYTGQKIEAIDRMMALGPQSRAFRTGEMLLDDRKSVPTRLANLLTGARFGTYDTEKWKAIDVAEAVRDQLKEEDQVREGRYYYVPQDRRGREPPGTIASIRRLRDLEEYLGLLKQRQLAEAR